MKLTNLKNNWEELGQSDPFWAVLTKPSKINNKWGEEEFYATGRKWMSRTFKSLNLDQYLNNKNTALDFGCGPGRLTQALCQEFEGVIGIDISSSMINKANDQNKFPEHCKYIVNDTDDLSQLAANQFDFVLSFITLQHIDKKSALNYIKEFARVAKKDGCILFNLPYKPPFLLKMITILIGLKGVNFLRRVFYRKKAVIEMHWIKEEEMLDFFENIGLFVLQIKESKGVGPNWGNNLYLLKKTK